MHLTLRFIGEVDGRDVDLIDDMLAGIMAPDFTLQLHAVGQFGNKQPHTLWAGVRPSPALEHLARKVDSAIRRVGQPQDAHPFKPHVTLARMRHPDNDKVMEWLSWHALYTSPEFAVDAFQLYSSRLTGDGSIYTVRKTIRLEAMMTKLAIEELKAALKRLPDWALAKDREAITRSFKFVDFDAAFAFMTRSALLAAKMDHHPEWFNVYNKVDVTLATHDADGVTQKDIDLATAMDGYAAMGGGR